MSQSTSAATPPPTTTAAVPPPLVHAISGSIGSTLSMLLLYPLERARIELQTQVTLPEESDVVNSDDCFDSNDENDENAENDEIVGNDEISSSSSEGKNNNDEIDDDDHDHDHQATKAKMKKQEKDVQQQQSKSSSEAASASEGSLSSGEFSYEVIPSSLLPSSPSSSPPPLPPPSPPSSPTVASKQQNKSTELNQNKNEKNHKKEETKGMIKIIDQSNIHQKQILEQSHHPQKNNNQPFTPSITKQKIIQPHRQRQQQQQQQDGIYNTIIKLYHRNELYKGVTPVATTLAISNFIFFYTLQFTKKIMQRIQIMNCGYTSNGSLNGNGNNGINGISCYLFELILIRWRGRRGNGNSSSSSSSIGSSGVRTNNASLLASTVAGIVNVLLTNPLWMANLRLIQYKEKDYDEDDNDEFHEDVSKQESRDDKVSNRTGTSLLETTATTTTRRKNQHPHKMTLWKMIRYIIQKEGFKELWNGTGTSLILVCNPAIQYYIYEKCKFGIISMRRNHSNNGQGRSSKSFFGLLLLERGRKTSSKMYNRNDDDHVDFAGTLSPLDAFILGAFAKAVATIMTYPLQLAQVLMRLQSSNNERKVKNNDKTRTGERKVQRRNEVEESDTPSTTSESMIQSNKVHEFESSQSLYRYSGTLDCMKQLYQQGGIQALYTGIDAKLLQTVLTSALTFLTYEQIVSVLAKTLVSLMKASPSSLPNA